jgi:hypothetical protein
MTTQHRRRTPGWTLPILLALPLWACGSDSGDANDESGSTGTTSPTTSATTPAAETTNGGSASVGSTSSAGESSSGGGNDTTGAPADSSSGGDDPLAFAGEMNGYRWELPCEDPSQRDTCPWDPALLQGAIDDPSATLHRETLVVFGGDPTVVYDVQIQIRGLSEPKDFTGGEVLENHFQIGGTPGTNDYNIYAIDVGDPAERYTLNRNEMGTGHYTFVMDYTVTIPIRGGTEIRLTMIDPNNIAIANPGGNIASGEPWVVPDIPPFPDPFYGQFIQMDVLSVTPQ